MSTPILGIESSCDETAAAVVEQGSRVLSNVVASQIATHQPYGGVVPELASREHLKAIVPIVGRALAEAGIGCDGLEAVAVTQGPGLVGSLLVGVTYGKALAFSRSLPLISVNHLEGHIHAVLLEQRLTGSPEVELPALALVVSGGHTLTCLVEQESGRFRYPVLGRTRDDAAGEAFDKVAKLLGLGYPGGPVVDRLAAHGNPHAVRFTPPKIKGNSLDFSFSGIKTAVLRYVESHALAAEIERRRVLLERQPLAPTESFLKLPTESFLELSSPTTLDLVASFQHSVVEQLVERTLAAAQLRDVRAIIVSGGVASLSIYLQFPAARALPAAPWQPADSRVLPQHGPFYRQRSDDRCGRLSQVSGPGFCRLRPARRAGLAAGRKRRLMGSAGDSQRCVPSWRRCVLIWRGTRPRRRRSPPGR